MESLDMATKVSLDLRSAACTPGSTSTKVVVVVLDLVEDEAVTSVPVVLLVATEEALRALLVLLLLIFRGGIRLLLPWHELKGRRDDDEKDPIALILDPIRPAVPLRTGAAKL